MAAVVLFWDTNMADVTSSEKALYIQCVTMGKRCLIRREWKQNGGSLTWMCSSKILTSRRPKSRRDPNLECATPLPFIYRNTISWVVLTQELAAAYYASHNYIIICFFIYLFIFVFCWWCIFMVIAYVGKLFFLKELLKLYLAGARFFRKSDSFLGQNVRYMYYEAHVWYRIKYLIQFITIASSYTDHLKLQWKLSNVTRKKNAFQSKKWCSNLVKFRGNTDNHLKNGCLFRLK